MCPAKVKAVLGLSGKISGECVIKIAGADAFWKAFIKSGLSVVRSLMPMIVRGVLLIFN